MRIQKAGSPEPLEQKPLDGQPDVTQDATNTSELGLGRAVGTEDSNEPNEPSVGIAAFVTNYGVALSDSTRDDNSTHQLNPQSGEQPVDNGDAGWFQGQIVKVDPDTQTDVSIGRKDSRPDKDDDD
ncbi:MAG TPA: hypothetical protein VFG11_04495 [Acidobacteriota bacterium]|nr:hypothetical protein [Acidobacteriota bacterium]